MKRILALLLLSPIIAHAGTWDLGIGYSDRARYGVEWDYTFDSTSAWHIQFNLGQLYAVRIEQHNTLLPRFPHMRTFYMGESLLYQTPHAFISVGVIELNTPTPYLTSKYQFLDDIGLRFGAYRIMFRHISNGNTGGRNGGESMLYLSADY